MWRLCLRRSLKRQTARRPGLQPRCLSPIGQAHRCGHAVLPISLSLSAPRCTLGFLVLSRSVCHSLTVRLRNSRPVSMFQRSSGGMRGAATNELYLCGIIDILQPYNVRKQLEHGFKSLRYDGVCSNDLFLLLLVYVLCLDFVLLFTSLLTVDRTYRIRSQRCIPFVRPAFHEFHAVDRGLSSL